MNQSLYEYCLEFNKMHLLDEWDATKNEGLTFKNISYGSKKKVWWRCKNGHQWETPVYVRTSANASCPYCTGRLRTPDAPTLASDYPTLVEEWTIV